MPTKKISDPKDDYPCLHPSHNPPNMMVFPPGTYVHTCDACGHESTFTVPAITC